MRKGMFVLMMVAVMALASSALAHGDGAQHASAVLYNTSGDQIGFARFTEDATGRVHVNVKASGLTEGLHGIHIHAVGSCVGPAFTSAGGHFNPTGHQHGLENPSGPHAGDLPNLVVNTAGMGHLNTTTDLTTLSALFDADGSALVIHAGPDDQVSNPAGNSGARVACGVIN